MENPIKMGWFGGTTIFGNIHIMCWLAWTKPALLSSCLCRTSLKQSSLYLPLALDLSRPTKKMQPNISISSTQHQKIQVSSICQWIGNWNPLIQNVNHHPKKNNNPPTFLFTKSPAWETAIVHLPAPPVIFFAKIVYPMLWMSAAQKPLHLRHGIPELSLPHRHRRLTVVAVNRCQATATHNHEILLGW